MHCGKTTLSVFCILGTCRLHQGALWVDKFISFLYFGNLQVRSRCIVGRQIYHLFLYFGNLQVTSRCIVGRQIYHLFLYFVNLQVRSRCIVGRQIYHLFLYFGNLQVTSRCIVGRFLKKNCVCMLETCRLN